MVRLPLAARSSKRVTRCWYCRENPARGSLIGDRIAGHRGPHCPQGWSTASALKPPENTPIIREELKDEGGLGRRLGTAEGGRPPEATGLPSSIVVSVKHAVLGGACRSAEDVGEACLTYAAAEWLTMMSPNRALAIAFLVFGLLQTTVPMIVQKLTAAIVYHHLSHGAITSCIVAAIVIAVFQAVRRPLARDCRDSLLRRTGVTGGL